MAAPRFAQHPLCRACMLIGRLIPVLFVLGIVGFGYYVYVFTTVPNLTESLWLRALVYLAFHGLLFMFLASYFVTIYSPVPKIPDRYYLPDEVLADFLEQRTDATRNSVLYRYATQHNIVVFNTSPTDGPRYCMVCKCIKPDRSHHCSVCGQRYDHHCPWVNNCVHNENYKMFLLFLIYGLILCLFVLACSVSGLVAVWKGDMLSNEITEKFTVIFLPFIAFLFGLSISFLLSYHIYLCGVAEQWSPPRFEQGYVKNPYNVGCCENLKQIFGRSKLLWLLPVYTTACDGLNFPLKRKRFFAEQFRLLDDESDDEQDTLNRGNLVNV